MGYVIKSGNYYWHPRLKKFEPLSDPINKPPHQIYKTRHGAEKALQALPKEVLCGLKPEIVEIN